MKKIIRLTERDLTRLVKRVLKEEDVDSYMKKMINPFRRLVGFNPEKPDGVEDEVLSDQELNNILDSLRSLYFDIYNDPELLESEKSYLIDKVIDLNLYIEERRMHPLN